MNTDEILAQLTPAQRTELDTGLAALAANTTADYKKNPDAFSEITTNVHLKGNIYLNATVSLHMGDKGFLHHVIENISAYASVDEYLNAVKAESAKK